MLSKGDVYKCTKCGKIVEVKATLFLGGQMTCCEKAMSRLIGLPLIPSTNGAIYKCMTCGNIVEVKEKPLFSIGEMTCCGNPMFWLPDY